MASVTVDPASDRPSVESIPEVDLRFLTQSELNALSQCSSFYYDLHRTDDLVIPKIDRAVFNESAGSRKQTYSRLRLAPRKPDLSATKAARPSSAPPDDPERAENLRVVSLFKRLLNPGSNDDQLVPVDVFEFKDDFPLLPEDTSALTDGVHAGERKRKRGRKPSTVKLDVGDEVAGGENKNKALVVYDENAREREKVQVNKHGVAVDLTWLANLEDPFGDEIRKRTKGLKADEELLGFMSRLPGQWGSRRKRRRIVDANDFGDALPIGWKVLIGMKKRMGQAWLFCRRYVSPNGRYFTSCKEVSSYLRSLCGLVGEAPISHHCYQASAADSKAALKVEPAPAKVNHDIPSAPSPLPASSDHEKQVVLVNDASATKQAGSSKQAGVYKCHRCSTPYYEKNDLLKHLLSCHKRKRRKAGMPVDDFEMLKAGPYDCQFCSKTFYERNVFFAHVGIHVKNYLKGISESGEGTATEKESSPVPIREIHPTGSEVKWHVDAVDSDRRIVVTKPPETASHGELHSAPYSVEKMHAAASSMEGLVDIVDSNRTAVTEPGTEGLNALHSIPISDEFKHAASTMEGHVDIVVSDCLAVVKPGTEGLNELHSVPNSGEIKPDVSSMEGRADIANSDPTTVTKPGTEDLNEHNSIHIPGEINHAVSSMEGHPDSVDSDCPLLTKSNTADHDELHSISISGEIKHAVSSMVGNADVVDGEATKLLSDKEQGAKDFGVEGSIEDQSTSVERKISAEIENQLGNVDGVADNAEADANSFSELKNLAFLAEDNGAHEPTFETNSSLSNTLLEDTLGVEDDKLISKEDKSVCLFNENHEIFVAKENESTELKQTMSRSDLEVDKDNNYPAVDGDARPFNTDVPELGSNGNLELQNVYDVTQSSMIDEDMEKANNDEISLHEKEVTNWPETMFGGSIKPSSSLPDNQQNCAVEDYEEMASKSSVHQGNLEAFIFKKNDNTFDFSSDDQVHEKVSSGMFLFPHHVEETCNTQSSVAKNKVERETKSSELVHTTAMFNLSGSLVGNVLDNEGLENISASWSHSPQGSREIPSNMTHHDGRIVNGMTPGRSSTADLTVLGRQDNSGADRAIFDFASGVSGIGTNVLSPVQADTMAGSSSAFSLWNNDHTFNVGSAQSRVQLGTRQASRQETPSQSSSLSLAGFQQTSNTRYNLNESFHLGTLENFSRLNTLEQPRDTDLMIGFSHNTNSRPGQGVAASQTLWRHGQGDALPCGLAESSSEQAQVSGAFRSFDFLSDKGDNDVFSMNEKFDSMPSFDGLRSTTVEPMEFSFLSPQESNAPHQLEDPKVLSYNDAGMVQGFDSSLWIGRDNSMSNLGGPQPVSTIICVWCRNEFQQEPIDPGSQSGSIGYLCPACKTGRYL